MKETRHAGQSRPFVAATPVELTAQQMSAQADVDFQKKITPLFVTYCYECHGNGKRESDFAIDTYKTAASVTNDPSTWETVQRYIHMHEMPPKDHPQPTEAERALASTWIDGALRRYYEQHVDPGRVTIHRLNRAEYNNTVHDLIGVDFRPADDFPADDSGYGFDNVGDVLSLPPVLMEKYLTAADQIVNEAIVTDPIQSKVQRIPASLAEVGFNAFGDRGDGWVKLVSLEEDDVAYEMPVLAAGDYILRVKAYATLDGGVNPYDPNDKFQPQSLEQYKKALADPPMKLSLMLNDAVVSEVALTTDENNPGIYEARMGVPSGKQRFRVSVRRQRGGAGELLMKNGRLGKEQAGVVYVRYLEIEGPLPCATRRYPVAQLQPTGTGSDTPTGGRLFTSAGEAAVAVDVPRDGDYILRAQAYAMQAGDDPARMRLSIDDKPVQTFDVLAPGKMTPLKNQRVFSLALLFPVPQVYEIHAKLTAGTHHFSAAFINPFTDEKTDNPNLRQRTLTIQHLEVADLSSPVLRPKMPDPVMQAFNAHVKLDEPATQTRDAARAIINDLARRAWRRPIEATELDRIMAMYDLAEKQGDVFEARIKLALKAVLVSPHFLFRGELQPEPDNPRSVHQIDEFALASRLSYFLWSSMPDDELLGLASRGQLRQNLPAQVKRMLASPKSAALVENFGGQWLQFRGLDSVSPDSSVYKNYDAALRQSMREETSRFFDYVMRQDRTVIDFLDGDYTFVNGRLAQLYGIDGVSGDDFQKVSLDGTQRRGILTQASVLTLTSNPNRTSPVKRGKWVLENLLGAPPPPPPPSVPSLDEEAKTVTGTLRHQMELHRANPTCASCHARMDPIGFGMENFDGIGQWRDQDAGQPVDAGGELLTGEAFKTPLELLQILANSRRDDFLHCLTEKMVTYALGRGVDVYDHAAVDRIADGLADDPRFSNLVLGIVQSVPFQMRRGEGDPTTAAN
jgi:hypothetical protein